MDRNDLCWCGSGKKYKHCHLNFDERLSEIKYNFFKGQVRPPHKIINNEKDIEGIRKSGVINDGVLDLMETLIRPGFHRRQQFLKRAISLILIRRRFSMAIMPMRPVCI